jgi:hypothetical protein
MKSCDSLFQPIHRQQERKPPSPFQTGLRYLRFLGQIKRQTDTTNFNLHQPTRSTLLERTPAYSTNYYAPLRSHAKHKSCQVDGIDDLSYETAVSTDESSLSFNELLVTCLSLTLFIVVLLYFQLNSRPIRCLLTRQFWYSIDLSHGITCADTARIEIHFIEMSSRIYQVEIHRNCHATNCFGFDVLSCVPIDHSSIPDNQIIQHHDLFIAACHQREQLDCSRNGSFSILPYEMKWHLKNIYDVSLLHCSCLSSTNTSTCFNWMLTDRCDLQIPWLDYCLKKSHQQWTCHAYLRRT